MAHAMDDLVGEAFRAFERWCRDHDPEGNMDVFDAAVAYNEWADKNSIERYLDAAQPVRGCR
jgi:hypothetical protein